MLILLLNVRICRVRYKSISHNVLSHRYDRLMIWLTIGHHKCLPLRCRCIDTSHHLRLRMEVRGVTNCMLAQRLVWFGVAPRDTYLLLSIFKWIQSLVAILILRLLVLLRVMTTLVCRRWLMAMITRMSLLLGVLLLVSILWTISTLMAIGSTAIWQLVSTAIFDVAFCVVRYSYGYNRK